MTYATQQNLIDRFGEAEIKRVADRDNNGTIDAGVVAKALADADAEIDGYIGKVYALPLTTVPPRVVDLAGEIGLYKLYPSNAPEDVVRRYNAAIAFLRDVAKGVAVLPIEGGAEPAPTTDGVQTTMPDRVFSRETLKGF